MAANTTLNINGISYSFNANGVYQNGGSAPSGSSSSSAPGFDLTSGSGAQAASYIHLMDVKTGKVTYGVGISSNITRASFRGIFSAVNRLFY